MFCNKIFKIFSTKVEGDNTFYFYNTKAKVLFLVYGKCFD